MDKVEYEEAIDHNEMCLCFVCVMIVLCAYNVQFLYEI